MHERFVSTADWTPRRGKNDFAEISKNLVKYRSEDNFVKPIKIIM